MIDNPRPKIWTTKTYNRLAKIYDLFMRVLFPIGEKGRKRIAEKLEVGSVLDVGCGTGTFLSLASAKGASCFGADLSSGMFRQAKEKAPQASLTRASFYVLPFPSGCFDNVVATNALSGTYIHAGDALAEMLRVCKSGGYVSIAEWPIPEEDTITERIFVKLASLNEDAPKDYVTIFGEFGVKPEIEPLDRHYSIFNVRKG